MNFHNFIFSLCIIQISDFIYQEYLLDFTNVPTVVCKQSKATVMATVRKLTNTIFKTLIKLLNEVYKLNVNCVFLQDPWNKTNVLCCDLLFELIQYINQFLIHETLFRMRYEVGVLKLYFFSNFLLSLSKKTPYFIKPTT